jgi:hypothetical protein
MDSLSVRSALTAHGALRQARRLPATTFRAAPARTTKSVKMACYIQTETLPIRQIEGGRDQIAASGALPQKLVEDIEAMRAKMVELAPRGDQHPSRRLVEALQAQVNTEVPPATLWVAPTEEA